MPIDTTTPIFSRTRTRAEELVEYTEHCRVGLHRELRAALLAVQDELGDCEGMGGDVPRYLPRLAKRLRCARFLSDAIRLTTEELAGLVGTAVQTTGGAS